MTADQFFEALGWVCAFGATCVAAEFRVKWVDERDERLARERRDKAQS